MAAPVLPPILIFGYGNPSRGDDAIGPEFVRLFTARLQPTAWVEQVELMTDFQLQIEHTLDLEGREMVVFVDASVDRSLQSYSLDPLQPEIEGGYTTHAMSPQGLLRVYQQISEQPLPRCWVLSIRGYQFGLGESISAATHQHLNQAVEMLHQEVRCCATEG